MDNEQHSLDNLARRIYKLQFRIGLILKVFIGIGAVLLVIRGNYQGGFESAVIFLITFLPVLMGRHFQVKIPPEFETVAIIFIYMSLFLGEVHGYYLRFWWWDMVLHGGSAFLIGVTGFLLVYVLNENPRIELHLKPFFISLFAFMFSMGIGAIWEIFEFTMDNMFGTNMQKSGLVDTMWDLIIDCAGALVISILGYHYLKAAADNSFLEHMIHKFIIDNPTLFKKRKFK